MIWNVIYSDALNQEKQFSGEAYWSYRTIDKHDELGGVLLHVMPKEFLDAVIRICRENHLTPMRLLPLTDVIAQQISARYESAEQVVLAVALFNERIEFVVASQSGEVLFVRELNYQWGAAEQNRLRVDIERTVLYVKQRQRGINRIMFHWGVTLKRSRMRWEMR